MRLVETAGSVLSWHDAIDIEDGKYVFWDATGSGVPGTNRGPRVQSMELSMEAFPLRNAFLTYLESIGLHGIDVEGTLVEV